MSTAFYQLTQAQKSVQINILHVAIDRTGPFLVIPSPTDQVNRLTTCYGAILIINLVTIDSFLTINGTNRLPNETKSNIINK